MTTIERPIKKALGDALDIYRDAMRPFVIRNLKRVPGKNLEDAIGAVLRDGQYNQFQKNLQDGRSVEDAIDIGEFPQLSGTGMTHFAPRSGGTCRLLAASSTPSRRRATGWRIPTART